MSPRQSEPVQLSIGQLERISGLAKRAHDGTVWVQPFEDASGLPWVEVTCLLTDMPEPERPLHVFKLDPRGNLRPRED